MIFEFAGVDGSGKSTLIGLSRRHINEDGSAFAYERSFQSEGVRLLEAVASAEVRRRPVAVFGREIVEIVRCVDLVRRSFDLQLYAASSTQHVMTDSYIVEQIGRLIQYGCCNEQSLGLVQRAVPPALTFYLRLSAEDAVERMRGRAKGDALLLTDDPVSTTREVIGGIEQALERCLVPVVELDASRSPEDLCGEVTSRIQALLLSAAGGESEATGQVRP